ncbi:MAG: hypothetical protein LUH22_00945 [Bacteroides sp.]|nr:hypothetical protein [Bacteroides sp.]
MKEEDKLLRKYGTENPFTVPEDYFANLTSEVMNKLPDQPVSDFVPKQPTRWDKIKPWTYMAAMFAGAALIIKIAAYNPNPFDNSGNATIAEAQVEMISDEELDFVLNQSMLDDYSLYMYLTDASSIE